MPRKTNKRLRLKKSTIVATVVGILLLVVIGLELTNTTHIFHKAPKVSVPSTPINKLPSQPAANNGEKKISNTSGITQQTSTDKHGQAPNSNASTDPSKWLISQSGRITVKLPLSGTTIKTGDELYGSASVEKVQYRLIDNQVGVISQGVIGVVNGNFTAGVNFKSYATTGRLDVFTTDDNGKESDEVQIPVIF